MVARSGTGDEVDSPRRGRAARPALRGPTCRRWCRSVAEEVGRWSRWRECRDARPGVRAQPVTEVARSRALAGEVWDRRVLGAGWVGGATTSRGDDPRRPWLLPVQGRPRSGDLRRQGQEPAPTPLELLPEPGVDGPAHRADGRHGRIRRVDPGPQRRRGAHARVQPHQAAPAAVQHPAEGRQELSVPGRDRRRRVAPSDGDAGRQEEGGALLRTVRPRLRHPRDPRPAAAHLPDPDVLGQQVRPPREARPAVPAVPHREVRRTLRRRGGPRALRRAGGRAARLPRRRHRHDRQPARAAHARRRRRAGVREGGSAARPAADGPQGDRQAADGRRAIRGPRRHRHRRGRARSGGPGVLRPTRAGGRVARGSSSTRSRTSRRAS